MLRGEKCLSFVPVRVPISISLSPHSLPLLAIGRGTGGAGWHQEPCSVPGKTSLQGLNFMRREEGRSREADSWAAARLPAGTSPLSIHVEVETKSLWIQSKAFSPSRIFCPGPMALLHSGPVKPASKCHGRWSARLQETQKTALRSPMQPFCRALGPHFPLQSRRPSSCYVQSPCTSASVSTLIGPSPHPGLCLCLLLRVGFMANTHTHII